METRETQMGQHYTSAKIQTLEEESHNIDPNVFLEGDRKIFVQFGLYLRRKALYSFDL